MDEPTRNAARAGLLPRCLSRRFKFILVYLLGMAGCLINPKDYPVGLTPGAAGTNGNSESGAAGSEADDTGGSPPESGGARGGSGNSIAGTNAVARGEAGAAGDGVDSGGSSGAPGFGGASGGHAGAGGTSGSAGSGVAGGGGSTITGGASGGPGIELIADFEDQMLLVAPIHKRNGLWYAFNNAPPAGVQTFGIALLTGANARAGSTAGLRMTASGFTGYGAGFGCDFVNTLKVKAPYDVSAYQGIRFYAKIGSGSQSSLKVLIPTTYSDPLGGKCDDTVATKKCNDHFYYPISSVTTTWDLYQFNFTDLMQQGFGLVQTSLDPTSVYGVQFTFVTTALAADFWLDDISFLLK